VVTPNTPENLAHLLRRTEFVVRPNRMAELAGGSIAQAVDNILDVGVNTNQIPPTNLTDVAPDGGGWTQYVAACDWWIGRMAGMERPFLEKMVLFWHGLYVSAWGDVGGGHRLMRQLQTYRTNALGNVITLTQAMAVDPAMLVYLSNAENYKDAPNENFARELMELFLLGANNGYTQADVQEVARAWTGHNAPWNQNEAMSHIYAFDPSEHDFGLKTIFGITKAWDGPEVINEILVGSKAQLSARYIAKKMWEFLAHPGAPAAVLDAVAPVFAADHDIKNLARNILNRDEFYALPAKQGLVRTPIEYFAALIYHSGLTADELGLSWGAESTGQQIFNPPNVSGWRPNGYWLNTSGISGRGNVAQRAIWRLQKPGAPFADKAVIYDKSVDAAVDFVANFFGITAMSPITRSAIVVTHQADRVSTQYRNWFTVGNLLMMVMMAPEFHMA
jgi:uncharacterized protein (DUF1800 family)